MPHFSSSGTGCSNRECEFEVDQQRGQYATYLGDPQVLTNAALGALAVGGDMIEIIYLKQRTVYFEVEEQKNSKKDLFDQPTLLHSPKGKEVVACARCFEARRVKYLWGREHLLEVVHALDVDDNAVTCTHAHPAG